jgi:hypothetical protein
VKIVFSRSTGYGQLLDLVQAHAYEMSVRAGELVPLEDATADWYETEYLPALAAVHEAQPPEAYRHTTKGTSSYACKASAANCGRRTGMRPGPRRPWLHAGRPCCTTSNGRSGADGGGLPSTRPIH